MSYIDGLFGLHIAIGWHNQEIYSQSEQTLILICKAKSQYLLIFQVSIYCIFALHISIAVSAVSELFDTA